MSRTLFDFLADSVLMNRDYITNSFHPLTDRELELEMEKYSAYCGTHMKEIVEEADKQGISAMVEDIPTIGRYPLQNLLKQSALYLDTIAIADPIYSICKPMSEFDSVHREAIGMTRKELNRNALSEACLFVKNLQLAVAAGYVMLIPNYEPIKESVPITFSHDLYQERIPQNYRDWFYNKAKVHNMEKTSQGLVVNSGQILEPGRRIAISFEGDEMNSNFFYHLFESEVLKLDDDTRIATFRQWLPDTRTFKRNIRDMGRSVD